MSLWKLKLCTKWGLGEHMLVAALVEGDWEGFRRHYEEWMLCRITPDHLRSFVKPYIPFDSSPEEIEEHKNRPLTEAEQAQYDRYLAELKPYWRNSLNVGGREYDIYDANPDFFPCGNAPSIDLTEEEAEAWKQEFRGPAPSPDSFTSGRLVGWVAFDDEVFLK